MNNLVDLNSLHEFKQLLIQQLVDFVPKICISSIIFLFFYISSRILEKAAFTLLKKNSKEEAICQFLAKLLKLSIILFGLISSLGTLGVDVSALIAGLGLTGFALGFALRDVLSNSLCGILIIFYKPFRIGQKVRIGSESGRISKIDIRYTTLVNEENSTEISIPNSQVFNSTIYVNKT